MVTLVLFEGSVRNDRERNLMAREHIRHHDSRAWVGSDIWRWADVPLVDLQRYQRRDIELGRGQYIVQYTTAAAEFEDSCDR